MGKRTRKTRWRTLAITSGEQSDSEESNSQSGHQATQKSHPPKALYSKFPYSSSQSTPIRNRFQNDSKSTRSSSTTSENKITFNEDEYTKITTPRQDVLFKKGYLSKPKTYQTQTSTGNSTVSTGNSTGNGTPDHQSADGTEGTDLEYESQFVFPNGYVDPNGIYYINSFEPYPPLVVYNAPYCYPDYPITRTKRYSTDSLTESTSPHNEETSQDQSQSGGETFGVSEDNAKILVNGHHSGDEEVETPEDCENAEQRKVKKRRRRKLSKPIPDDGTTSEDSEEPKTNTRISDDQKQTKEVKKIELKPDAKEFVPRAYQTPYIPNFIPLPLISELHPAFLPPGIPVNFMHNYVNFIPNYVPSNINNNNKLHEAQEESVEVEVEKQVEIKEEVQNYKKNIDIDKIVSKLEEAAKEQRFHENRKQKYSPHHKYNQSKSYAKKIVSGKPEHCSNPKPNYAEVALLKTKNPVAEKSTIIESPKPKVATRSLNEWISVSRKKRKNKSPVEEQEIEEIEDVDEESTLVNNVQEDEFEVYDVSKLQDVVVPDTVETQEVSRLETSEATGEEENKEEDCDEIEKLIRSLEEIEAKTNLLKKKNKSVKSRRVIITDLDVSHHNDVLKSPVRVIKGIDGTADVQLVEVNDTVSLNEKHVTTEHVKQTYDADLREINGKNCVDFKQTHSEKKLNGNIKIKCEERNDHVEEKHNINSKQVNGDCKIKREGRNGHVEIKHNVNSKQMNGDSKTNYQIVEKQTGIAKVDEEQQNSKLKFNEVLNDNFTSKNKKMTMKKTPQENMKNYTNKELDKSTCEDNKETSNISSKNIIHVNENIKKCASNDDQNHVGMKKSISNTSLNNMKKNISNTSSDKLKKSASIDKSKKEYSKENAEESLSKKSISLENTKNERNDAPEIKKSTSNVSLKEDCSISLKNCIEKKDTISQQNETNEDTKVMNGGISTNKQQKNSIIAENGRIDSSEKINLINGTICEQDNKNSLVGANQDRLKNGKVTANENNQKKNIRVNGNADKLLTNGKHEDKLNKIATSNGVGPINNSKSSNGFVKNAKLLSRKENTQVSNNMITMEASQTSSNADEVNTKKESRLNEYNNKKETEKETILNEEINKQQVENAPRLIKENGIQITSSLNEDNGKFQTDVSLSLHEDISLSLKEDTTKLYTQISSTLNGDCSKQNKSKSPRPIEEIFQNLKKKGLDDMLKPQGLKPERQENNRTKKGNGTIDVVQEDRVIFEENGKKYYASDFVVKEERDEENGFISVSRQRKQKKKGDERKQQVEENTVNGLHKDDNKLGDKKEVPSSEDRTEPENCDKNNDVINKINDVVVSEKEATSNTNNANLTDNDEHVISAIKDTIKIDEIKKKVDDAVKVIQIEDSETNNIRTLQKQLSSESDTPEKKRTAKKKKKSSKPKTTKNFDQTYDFLLNSTFQESEKTNIEISEELSKIIQRGMYSSLEEKIKSLNITANNDGFFKTINIYEPAEKKNDLTNVANTSSIFRKPKRSVDNLDLDLTKMNLPNVSGSFLDLSNSQKDPGRAIQKEEEENKETLYPITQAVKDWMTKTRETTPEVEILKSPTTILKQVLKKDDLDDGEDEDVVVFSKDWSLTPETSFEEDLLEWDDEIEMKKVREDKVDVAEDVLEVYESKYGKNEDYEKIKEEIKEKKSASFPKHQNLPYRAICCSLM